MLLSFVHETHILWEFNLNYYVCKLYELFIIIIIDEELLNNYYLLYYSRFIYLCWSLLLLEYLAKIHFFYMPK